MKCRGMSVRSSTRCVVLQRKCNRTNAGSDRSFQFCAWPLVADAFVEDLLQVLAAALVKVFGCRPMTVVPPAEGAGVRKPPRDETAGFGRRSCSEPYGDFILIIPVSSTGPSG